MQLPDERSVFDLNAARAGQLAIQILLLVGGGPGLYSVVMTSWCAGPHSNSAVSKPVQYGEVCEIPGLPGTGTSAPV